jgi:hydroxymethylbilane synthase
MPDSLPIKLRLGTRGSLLARMQSQQVADQLQRIHPQVAVELVILRTTGDVIQDRPLAELGGKGLFVKELEQALLAGQIDFAVHSYKDVPVTMPVLDQSALVIAAAPVRGSPQDIAVVRDAATFAWPARARVGTGSLRRRCQILQAHPDAIVLPLRGNIDTRLRKLREGEFDAVILAAAGLERAGLYDPARMIGTEFLPAAGQGALALQCRRGDQQTRQLLAGMNDPTTALCVDAERAVVARLRGDCHSPIAAWATVGPRVLGNSSRNPGHPSEVGRLRLEALVGAAGGHLPIVRADRNLQDAADVAAEMRKLVEQVCDDLQRQGAMELLHGKASKIADQG